MESKRRSGRPRKAEHEKITYQRIAVNSADYQKLAEELKRRDVKLVDAFSEMVANYLR